MHPPLDELADLLSRERAGLLAAVAAIPSDRLDDPPAPGAWSAAQLVEHLHLVEMGAARLLAKRLQRAREAGLGEETDTSSRLDALDRSAITAGTPREAPDIVAPPADVTAEVALQHLAASRDALLDVMREGDGLALSQVRAVHPIFGDIDFYQWVLFVALHEERHERQLRTIATALA